MRDTGGAGDMLHMIIGGAGCGKSTRLNLTRNYTESSDRRRSTSWKPIALSRWHVLSFSVSDAYRTAEKMRMN